MSIYTHSRYGWLFKDEYIIRVIDFKEEIDFHYYYYD
jgi:hypothetical protein